MRGVDGGERGGRGRWVNGADKEEGEGSEKKER